MIINIIVTIISLLIYDFLKKIIKLYFIKKNKNYLKKIVNNIGKNIVIDKDFWEE